MRRYILLMLAFLAIGGGTAQAQLKGRALPSKTQRAWLVKDRLYVEVGVTNAIDPDPTADPSVLPTYPYGEHFGNRLGDVIPFRVRVYAVRPADANTRPVELDFAPLKAGRLTFDPDPENDPDWVLCDPAVLGAGDKALQLPEKPQLVTIRTPDGREREADLWDIRVFVQTKRRPDPMLFWVEFAYATDVTPNGAIDWKVAASPDFIVSQSRTSDNGNDLQMGNSSTLSQRPPRLFGLALCTLGLVLVLVPTGRYIVRKARSLLHREVVLDPAEVAWKVFDEVFTRTKVEKGYNPDHKDVVLVVKTLKEFYGITGSVQQVFDKRFAIDDGEELYRILNSLEHGVLENGAVLEPQDYAKFFERITKLVPRP